jgi:Concanavalin A-like lectin/glucanases superfamily
VHNGSGTRPAGRHRRPRSRPQRRTRVLLSLAGFMLLGALTPPTAATFTALSTSGAHSIGAAATFPTYPVAVTNSAAWAFHRGEEAPSAASTSTAADSSANARTGTYAGATDGPTTFWKFDENSGSTAADASGAVNTGTLTNSPAWTTGRSGAALDFDGTGTSVRGAGPAVHTDRDFTATAWVWLRGTAGGADRSVLSQNGATTSGFDLRYHASTNKWAFAVPRADATGATVDQAFSTGAVTTGAWVHLAGVYSDSLNTLTLYVNGTAGGTAPHLDADEWDSSGSLQAGRSRWDGTDGTPFDGRIDDVRVFHRALSGAEITDLVNGAVAPAMTAGVTGALQGPQQGQQATTAVAFAGAGNAYDDTTQTNPATFTVECWFKTAGSAGGMIIGFGDTPSGATTAGDRQIYVDSGGRLTFGTWVAATSTAQTVRSPAAYADGAWHHVAGSLGSGGLRLYVDGVRVASNAAVTTAQNYTGYWRWGGGSVAGWPNAPAAGHLTGTIDEVAVYTTQLPDDQIALHYHANH